MNKDKLKNIKFRPAIITEQTVLWFGKWKGSIIKHIINSDPGYLIWAADEGILLFDDDTYMAIQKATETMNDNTNYRED